MSGFVFPLQAFAELQVKMIETNQRVRVAEGQISALKRSVAHAQLTDQELAALPDGTNTYQAVGRMCVEGGAHILLYSQLSYTMIKAVKTS